MFYHLKLNLKDVDFFLDCLNTTQKSLLVGLNTSYRNKERSEKGELLTHTYFMDVQYVSGLLNKASQIAHYCENDYVEIRIIYRDMDVFSSLLTREMDLHSNYADTVLNRDLNHNIIDEVKSDVVRLQSLLDQILRSPEVEVSNEEILNL